MPACILPESKGASLRGVHNRLPVFCRPVESPDTVQGLRQKQSHNVLCLFPPACPFTSQLQLHSAYSNMALGPVCWPVLLQLTWIAWLVPHRMGPPSSTRREHTSLLGMVSDCLPLSQLPAKAPSSHPLIVPDSLAAS